MMTEKKHNKNELRKIKQAEHLRKIMAFEREMIGILGTWICRLRHVDAKYMATHHLWEWAQHVDKARNRLKELPGVKIDTPLDPHLVEILEETLFAKDESPYLEALYTAIIPVVIKEYEEFLKATNELPDRPSTTLVVGIVQELKKQIDEGLAFLTEAYVYNENKKSEWSIHIENLLNHSNGISKEADINVIKQKRWFNNQKYTTPEIAKRVEGTHFTYDFPIENFNGYFENIDTERVALAVWLFNEMDAAEYIPTILYEIKDMPWEFYYDVSRHTWDEARHSEFGYQLLKQMDFDPNDFEVNASTYMTTMKLAPHERYAAVTYIYEPGSFQVKPNYLERLSNEISSEDWVAELLRFDLADETNHVRYGKKWVGKLIEHYKDERDVHDFVVNVGEKLNKVREKQSKEFKTTLPADKRMTYDKVKEHMKEFYEKQGSLIISFNKNLK